MEGNNKNISNGVMLNAYPDSIGEKFSDSNATNARVQGCFFCYTFCLLFNSDLDRVFSLSIIT
jgi:sucrose phosphorylase